MMLSQRRPTPLRPIPEISCADCALSPLCLPTSLDAAKRDQFNDIVTRSCRPLPRDSILFHTGQRFQGLYAIRSGAVKTYLGSASGEEQVTGFYLPGEIVGLDSIGLSDGNYGSTAVTLETTLVCTLPFSALEDLASRMPELQHHLFNLMSEEIRKDRHVLQLLGRRTAEQRLASFLLTLSSRCKRRRLSDQNLHLAMSRTDIANHLGLALETVSRLFTRFQQQGILRVNGRDIEIQDRDLLIGIAEGDNVAPAASPPSLTPTPVRSLYSRA